MNGIFVHMLVPLQNLWMHMALENYWFHRLWVIAENHWWSQSWGIAQSSILLGAIIKNNALCGLELLLFVFELPCKWIKNNPRYWSCKPKFVEPIDHPREQSNYINVTHFPNLLCQSNDRPNLNKSTMDLKYIAIQQIYLYITMRVQLGNRF